MRIDMEVKVKDLHLHAKTNARKLESVHITYAWMRPERSLAPPPGAAAPPTGPYAPDIIPDILNSTGRRDSSDTITLHTLFHFFKKNFMTAIQLKTFLFG